MLTRSQPKAKMTLKLIFLLTYMWQFYKTKGNKKSGIEIIPDFKVMINLVYFMRATMMRAVIHSSRIKALI